MIYSVYILTNRKNGTLYIGMTNNLIKRTWEHKKDLIEGFTNKYKTHFLVYFENYSNINDAIIREKRLKKWNREWKIKLIEKNNRDWKDLYNQLI